MRGLASHAASDRAFLSLLRRDPHAALAAHGYDLTEKELAAVLDLRRRTVGLGDGMVAALLAGGLGKNAGDPSPRPRSPGRPSGGPSKPDRPGGRRGRPG